MPTRVKVPTRASGTLLALAGLLAQLGGCEQHQSEAASPAPTPAVNGAATVTAPSTPRPTYTLILTWMNGDQPPQTTQTVFHALDACARARDAAIAEGRRLALEALATPVASDTKAPPPVARRYVGSALLPSDPSTPAAAPPPAPPKVAAICAVDAVAQTAVTQAAAPVAAPSSATP